MPDDRLETADDDAGLVAQAREFGLTISRAAEDGVARAITAEQERVWRLENDDAMRQANDYIERHGLPLARYRQF